MYEYMGAGLGWATVFETNWLGGRTDTPKTCIELSDRGVPAVETQQRCFKETVAERLLAEQSECVRMGYACDVSGDAGATWCCAVGRPASQLPGGVVTPGEPEVVVVPPPGGDPRPISEHTVLSRLAHPGALMALGLIGVAGFLGYRMLVSQRDRAAEEFARNV